MSSNGHPVQILRFDNGELRLFPDKLRDILTHPSVKDLPVVPVSIAGKKRFGKSLLLSNFVRYSQLQGRDGWLTDYFGPLEGFVFKGGSTGVTTGIYIWSELFVVELPTNKRVAVMFMDTQGSFDTRCDLKESSVVFALSTMISSVQIYNISKFLAGDDLQHLQMFIEYGKLAQKYDPGSAGAFQSLQILVRDWMDTDEAEYGYVGGQRHLTKVMDVEAVENAASQSLVNDIKTSFSSISCFLMPEPEKCVRDGTFDGTPSNLGKDFSANLCDFVDHILHPTKLVVKQQAGREIKTCQLLYQFESLVIIFNKEMPSAQSLIEGTAEASYLIAIDEAMSVFMNIAEDELRSAVPDSIDSLSEKLQGLIVEDFARTPRMGGEAMAQKYTKILEEKILNAVFALQNRLEGERKIDALERLLQEYEDQHIAEILQAEEQAEERVRKIKSRHNSNVALLQQEFEDRCIAMSAEERRRAQEELDQRLKEQTERDKSESDQILKENQERIDNSFREIKEELRTKLDELLQAQSRPPPLRPPNYEYIGKTALGLLKIVPGSQSLVAIGHAVLYAVLMYSRRRTPPEQQQRGPNV